MDDLLTYRVKVRGLVSENELNAIASVQILDVRADDENTSFSVSTDQSGLIGLLRQLHGRGLALLSVSCEQILQGKI
jgi:hypothetical protein